MAFYRKTITSHRCSKKHVESSWQLYFLAFRCHCYQPRVHIFQISFLESKKLRNISRYLHFRQQQQLQQANMTILYLYTNHIAHSSSNEQKQNHFENNKWRKVFPSFIFSKYFGIIMLLECVCVCVYVKQNKTHKIKQETKTKKRENNERKRTKHCKPRHIGRNFLITVFWMRGPNVRCKPSTPRFIPRRSKHLWVANRLFTSFPLYYARTPARLNFNRMSTFSFASTFFSSFSFFFF